jgi:regulator of RNase E activity RraB
MRGIIFRLIPVCLVLVSAPAAFAAEPSRGEAILRLLGFDTAISSFVAEVKSTDTGLESNYPEFDAARDALAERIFRPDALFTAVAARVDDKFDDAEYDALEAYFSQGVGLRVTQAEKYAQSPENDAERAAETPAIIEDLLANNPERLDQIEQMIEAMDVVGSGTAMAMNLAYAMISGMASTGKLPGGMTDDQILMMLNARRDQIEAEVFNNTVLSAAFTYRDISNADMADYLDFLQSDLGRKLYSVMESAQVEVLTAASRKFGHDLMVLSGVREL